MEAPLVRIKQGQLKGCIRTDIDGGQIFSFLGIPFAKPPVGELRFKAPVPAEPWSGIKDASEEGNNCYARDLFTRIIDGSEDCLNLNVYTKSLPGSGGTLKPVMVFIHGGAFITGSNKPSMYGPEFLLIEDIVLVVINYRLGALGFLSSDDESLDVPGNAGLKDQVLALKWVQENIKNFNGDPNNVTIFGESAGSGSVHYLVLSPSAKGLFHKAIMQSGCALNHWAEGQRMMVALAKELGHDVSNDKEAWKVLKGISAEELFLAQERLDERKTSSEKPYFVPVIEKPNGTAFITERPINIIRSGNSNKVALMFGYTTREGLLLTTIAAMKGNVAKNDSPNLEDVISWQLGLELGSDTSKEVCQKLMKTYFKGPDMADNVALVYTDSLFVAGIIAAVKNHSETSQSPVYLYRMSIEAELNIVKNFAKLTSPGACHGDDIGYLFKGFMTPPIQPGSIEDKTLRRFVKLWTNFAKYGNPTPDEKEFGVTWKPVEQGNLHFIDLGEEFTTDVNPESERIQLWKEIFQLSPNTENFL